MVAKYQQLLLDGKHLRWAWHLCTRLHLQPIILQALHNTLLSVIHDLITWLLVTTRMGATGLMLISMLAPVYTFRSWIVFPGRRTLLIAGPRRYTRFPDLMLHIGRCRHTWLEGVNNRKLRIVSFKHCCGTPRLHAKRFTHMDGTNARLVLMAQLSMHHALRAHGHFYYLDHVDADNGRVTISTSYKLHMTVGGLVRYKLMGITMQIFHMSRILPQHIASMLLSMLLCTALYGFSYLFYHMPLECPYNKQGGGRRNTVNIGPPQPTVLARRSQRLLSSAHTTSLNSGDTSLAPAQMYCEPQLQLHCGIHALNAMVGFKLAHGPKVLHDLRQCWPQGMIANAGISHYGHGGNFSPTALNRWLWLFVKQHVCLVHFLTNVDLDVSYTHEDIMTKLPPGCEAILMLHRLDNLVTVDPNHRDREQPRHYVCLRKNTTTGQWYLLDSLHHRQPKQLTHDDWSRLRGAFLLYGCN